MKFLQCSFQRDATRTYCWGAPDDAAVEAGSTVEVMRSGAPTRVFVRSVSNERPESVPGHVEIAMILRVIDIPDGATHSLPDGEADGLVGGAGLVPDARGGFRPKMHEDDAGDRPLSDDKQ